VFVTSLRAGPGRLSAARRSDVGSVRFRCSCGEFSFLDSTDNRSYVAHLIPDQEWDGFWGAIDDAVEKSGSAARDKADACVALRRSRVRMAWQCPRCGGLYIEDPEGRPQRFVPESPAVSRRLLRGGGRD
jgi:hypothetical protein